MDEAELPPDDPALDQLVADLARPMNGVTSRGRLITAGLSDDAVRHRLNRGSLHEILPQIYLVGHAALTPDRIWWSAVLAGSGRLTGRAWLEACGLLEPEPWNVDVVIPPTRKSRVLTCAYDFADRPIIVTLRRGWEWPGDDGPTSRRHGLPGVDVHDALTRAAAASEQDFLDALREAERSRIVHDDRLRGTVRKGRAGSTVVRARLRKRAIGSLIVVNDFEEKGLELFARLGMPVPQVNVWVDTPTGRVHVDFWWPELRLVIEFDGRKDHESIGGVMRDHEQDARLRGAGIDVMHFDWWQANEHPEQISGSLVGAGYLAEDLAA